MMRSFKLKINGESPRGLLIAFIFAKLKCDVHIYNFSTSSNSEKDYQIFLFSNSSKNLLSKLDIWNEIENISYGFNSLGIIDNLVSEQILLRTENFSKKNSNTIGWTANYSDIKILLLNKLIKSDNVHFISKSQLIDESLNFDYEINFINYDKKVNLFNFPLSTFKRINKKILIFNVYLRGHIEKRFYEINTPKGLLILTPLNRNLYQIIWYNASFLLKETSINSKSFLLDNLTTLLPNKFKIDQIIGDVNFEPFSNNTSTYIIKNKSIYFNENKFKSNTLYNFKLDFIIRNTLKIYNFYQKSQTKNFTILNKFGCYYLYREYLELKIKSSLSNFLINLFILNNLPSSNNIFLFLLRKSFFSLIKRINLFNVLFNKSSCNSHIINLNKF